MSTATAKKERAVASLAYGIIEYAQNTNATLLQTGGLVTVTDVPDTHGKAPIVKNNARTRQKKRKENAVRQNKAEYFVCAPDLPRHAQGCAGNSGKKGKKAKKACGFAPAFTAKTSPPRGNP